MDVISSVFPDYTIATDYYPYNETRKILEETHWWWEHDARSKDADKASNYILNPTLTNSIETSLSMRMHRGCFNFIFYKDELFLYSGLRIDKNNNAWIHRAATHPELGKHHIGALTGIMMPHQARYAKSMGCVSYNASWNESNYKFYLYFKNKHYYRGKLRPIRGGEKIMDAFDFPEEKVFLYEQEQYIATLDLTRPDIEEVLTIS